MPASRDYGSANTPPTDTVRLTGRLKRTAWATITVCVLSAVGFALLVAPRRITVSAPVELAWGENGGGDPAYNAYVAQHGITGDTDFTVRCLPLLIGCLCS